MTTQQFNRMIAKNQSMVVERQKLSAISKHIENIIDATITANIDLEQFNFIIAIIRHLKDSIIYFENEYGKICEETEIICRSIRKKFNNLFKNKKVKIITNNCIFNEYITDDLSLYYDKDLNECCYIFSTSENGNVIMGTILIQNLKRIQSVK